MAVNTLAALTNEQKTFYERVLLERLKPNLVFYNYGEKKTIPKNEGLTINFRRFDALEPNTTALTEGVTPAGKSISVSKVEATLKQLGDFITTTDVIDLAAIDKVVTEMTEVLGEQAGASIDKCVSDVVTKGTNVMYAKGAATSAIGATDVVTSTLIKKCVRTLRANNVKPYEGGYYIGVIHPNIAYDIMNDPLWEDVSKYNGGQAIVAGEVGRLAGVKFVESTYSPIKSGEGASSADVYCSMIFGKGFYAVPDLDGKAKPEMIVKPLGSAGTADPLDQRASVGWKAFFTTARLNELCGIRLESGATI